MRRSILLSALAVCACGEPASDVDLPERELASSAHFRYFTRPEDTFTCRALPDILERHRTALAAYTGAGDGPGSRIEYYKFLDVRDLVEHGPCVQRAGGVAQCQRRDRLYAYEPFQQHELVHAYTAPLGRSARFLDEGLAEALSCGFAKREREGVSLEALVSWSEDYGDYEALQAEASIFVAHLVNGWGPDAFLGVFRELRPGATISDVDGAFRRVYGESASDLHAAMGGANLGGGCVRAWECSGPAWDATRNFEVDDTCGAPSFTPFDVTAPSLFVGFVARLGACDPRRSVPGKSASYAIPMGATLEPGRYFLGMPPAVSGAPPVSVPAALYALDSVLGDRAACSGLEAVQTQISGLQLSFSVETLARARSGPFWLRLHDGTLPVRKRIASMNGAELRLSARCDEGLDVRLCDGCAAPSSCAAVCSTTGSDTAGVANAVAVPDEPVLSITVGDAALEAVLSVSFDYVESSP